MIPGSFFAAHTLAFLAQISLAPLLQEQTTNWGLAILFALIGVILVIAFWYWWQNIVAEDSSADLRTRNMPMLPEKQRQPGVVPPAAYERVTGHVPGLPVAGGYTRAPEPQMAVPTAVAAAEAAPETAAAPADLQAAPDDLTRIEGIGPKISLLLQEAGLQTFAQLAAASPEQIAAILEAAGPRYKLADPTSWPDQAALAAAGSWEALERMQLSLQGGRAAEPSPSE